MSTSPDHTNSPEEQSEFETGANASASESVSYPKILADAAAIMTARTAEINAIVLPEEQERLDAKKPEVLRQEDRKWELLAREEALKRVRVKYKLPNGDVVEDTVIPADPAVMPDTESSDPDTDTDKWIGCRYTPDSPPPTQWCVRYGFRHIPGQRKKSSWWRHVQVPGYLMYLSKPREFKVYCASMITDAIRPGWKPCMKEIGRNLHMSEPSVQRACRKLEELGVWTGAEQYVRYQIIDWKPTNAMNFDPKIMGRVRPWFTATTPPKRWSRTNWDFMNGLVPVPEWAVWALPKEALVVYVHLLRRRGDPAGGATTDPDMKGIGQNMRTQTWGPEPRFDGAACAQALGMTPETLSNHIKTLEQYGAAEAVRLPGRNGGLTTLTIHPEPLDVHKEHVWLELTEPYDPAKDTSKARTNHKKRKAEAARRAARRAAEEALNTPAPGDEF